VWRQCVYTFCRQSPTTSSSSCTYPGGEQG
jgi:hypothetical protein